ncbi:MAG TPA: 50S ribosomal protein L29 [Acholeplasmatales bacterium]|nr:50S ribosomal protein L29 [Bacillota bacterium]HAQ57152.1 50S ribosomal protein L29 [Acholeplasmatales bacterium]
MHVSEIRKMDNAAILKEIDTLKKELFDLRFKHATGQLENTARLNTVKKSIARMKTILTERAAE